MRRQDCDAGAIGAEALAAGERHTGKLRLSDVKEVFEQMRNYG
jgi:hypothetical protein